ncbi:general transcription factor II-I repeat domain-containing protein 2-like [Erpetoichthys calabaricus]|uniref:general transcription factor II-I repeat domain-containing protein 2-like n=1 Tax=Erpetoichthys calabaricus TaxID=27687 RepID=UPI0022344DC7|nr:general transcription factor II-I repeat domain-containing protein 2-like [Erpetoichthys calabaricus]
MMLQVIAKLALMMPKRKVDSENRAFKNRWEAEYMFTDVAGKPVCLICGANVAVIKEFNLRRHYETKHQDNLKDLNAKQKIQKAEELKKNLTLQQTFFTRAKSESISSEAAFMGDTNAPVQLAPLSLLERNVEPSRHNGVPKYALY